ncbi:MAG: ATP-binding protein [Planctomycetia bacterium]|nr:ATP-binding protein [Planctomycetia bacterium]
MGEHERDRIAAPGESLVCVSVEDNGGGIPLEEQEHIFSLFISTKGSRGTGLGLLVSRKSVKEDRPARRIVLSCVAKRRAGLRRVSIPGIEMPG